jgi:hypothetical protein
MPDMIRTHARRRLKLVTPDEASSRPLVHKLLDRPELIERIRGLIPDLERAHLVPYAPGWGDRELAARLGIPLYGSDPRHLGLGTKSAARRIFADEAVAHPFGREKLHSEADVRNAVLEMRAERPDLESVVVKLDHGAAGGSNACLDLTDLAPSGSVREPAQIEARIRDMRCMLSRMSYAEFFERMQTEGGIVEEFITGDEELSPSVQMRITPLGEVEILSTHDQRLGGVNKQRFIGSRFPARREYADLICEEAMKVARRLAAEGVLGRFAIDFVVARSGGEPWQSFAIEINLRQGGTTHTYLMLKFLTGGDFDPVLGAFNASDGVRKFYVASDDVRSEAFTRYTVDSFLDAVDRRRLRFDPDRKVGSVFHMISGLPTLGRVGLTAIGDSREEAEDRYHRTVEVISEEAEVMPTGAPVRVLTGV